MCASPLLVPPCLSAAYTGARLARGIDCTLRTSTHLSLFLYKKKKKRRESTATHTLPVVEAARWYPKALPMGTKVRYSSRSPADSLPSYVDSHWVRPLTEVPSSVLQHHTKKKRWCDAASTVSTQEGGSMTVPFFIFSKGRVPASRCVAPKPNQHRQLLFAERGD